MADELVTADELGMTADRTPAPVEVAPVWWARIDNNMVVEIVNHSDPRPNYHPDVKWLLVPPGLELFVNRDWVGPGLRLRPPSLAYFRKQVAAVIAGSRWNAQASGVFIGNLKYHTDETSTSTYTGAVVQGQAFEGVNGAGTFRTVWKTDGTGFVELGLTDLIQIGGAVALYISSCFSREEQITVLLDQAVSDLMAAIMPPESDDPDYIPPPPKDFDVSVIWQIVEPELAKWPSNKIDLAALVNKPDAA